MNKIRFSRATKDDEATVLSLAERLVAFGPPPWRTAEAITAVDQQRLSANMQKNSNEAIVIVACSGGDTVGFVHVHMTEDDYRDRPVAHISDVVVAPAAEGQGLGRALIAEAERWARDRGIDWLTLAAFVGNTRAIALYERIGFETDTVRFVKPLAIDAATDREDR